VLKNEKQPPVQAACQAFVTFQCIATVLRMPLVSMQALHPASDKLQPPRKPPMTAHASRPLPNSLLLLLYQILW
jgi:hypothetical protein